VAMHSFWLVVILIIRTPVPKECIDSQNLGSVFKDGLQDLLFLIRQS